MNDTVQGAEILLDPRSKALLMSQRFLWAENFIPIFPKEKQTLKHEQNPKYNWVLALLAQ